MGVGVYVIILPWPGMSLSWQEGSLLLLLLLFWVCWLLVLVLLAGYSHLAGGQWWEGSWHQSVLGSHMLGGVGAVWLGVVTLWQLYNVVKGTWNKDRVLQSKSIEIIDLPWLAPWVF